MQSIKTRHNKQRTVKNEASLLSIMNTFPRRRRISMTNAAEIVEGECRRFGRWAIGATPGATSHRHTDAAGSCTFLLVHSGRELWIMRERKHWAPSHNDVVELGAGDLQ
jgi:hypothetical protein